MKGFAATDARYCNEGPYGYDYKYPVSIETTASLNEEIINWRFYSEYAKSGVDKSSCNGNENSIIFLIMASI